MSIAAASVLAKTYRDNLMKELDLQFPDYHWKNNKGYPTKQQAFNYLFKGRVRN